MRSARITVRLPNELRRRLKAAAKRGGRRESELIRAAVEQQVAAEEATLSAYDHLKKAGLIGIIKGGPRDLATNPKYFEGFGKS